MEQKTNLFQWNILGGIGVFLQSCGLTIWVALQIYLLHSYMYISEGKDISKVLSLLGIVCITLWTSGIVLLLNAIHQYSKILKEKSIFDVFIVVVILGFLLGFIPTVNPIILDLFNIQLTDMEFSFLQTLSIYIMGICLMYSTKKGFEIIGEKLNHNSFRIGGKILFIGAIIPVVPVGLIIEFTGWIIITVAFFTAPKEFA
jgi:uncharacterized membrane protein